MRTTVIATAALLLGASTSFAADWPLTDIGQARELVIKYETGSITECLKDSGTEAVYNFIQQDINDDGINELIVTSMPKELGKGATGCYGRVGMHMYLLAKEGGAWKALTASNDASEFRFHKRALGQMPDIEMVGPGFCLPVERFEGGLYKLWKACDDNEQLDVMDAPWTEGKPLVATKDDGGPVKTSEGAKGNNNTNQDYSDFQANLAAIPFDLEADLGPAQLRPFYDHNSSQTYIDPEQGIIIYTRPRPGISGTVKPGMLLFKAESGWDPYDNTTIDGTAYTFKKGCEPAPYKVKGRHEGWHTLILKGKAPVRAKNGCAITGYAMNGNSTLKFESYGD